MQNYWLGHALSQFRTSAQGAAHEVGHRVGPDSLGRVYEYVHFLDATTKGAPVGRYRSGTKNFVVKNLSSATFGGVAGVTQGSGGAALSYGWIQTDGLGNVNLRVTGTTGADKLLYWTEDGKASVNPTQGSAFLNPFARTMAAKSGTNVVANKYVLRCSDQGLKKGVGATHDSNLETFVTTAEHDVGFQYTDHLGRTFEYVQFHTAPAKGAVVGYMYSGSSQKVTHTIGSSSKYAVAGVVQGSAAAANKYGWIQKGGYGRINMKITAGVSAGKYIFWSEDSKGARPVSGTVNVAASFAIALRNKSAANIVAGKYYLLKR